MGTNEVLDSTVSPIGDVRISTNGTHIAIGLKPIKVKLSLYLLTPWCRVLLEKITGLQLVKKFPAFHGTRRFITALTSVRHLSYPGPAQSSPYTHTPPPGDPY